MVEDVRNAVPALFFTSFIGSLCVLSLRVSFGHDRQCLKIVCIYYVDRRGDDGRNERGERTAGDHVVFCAKIARVLYVTRIL